MRTFNQRYSNVSNQRVLRPRITIAMHFEDDGSDIVYFTSHDDTQRPTGELVQAVDGCVVDFSGATQKINPKNSESSIGSISFELLNADRAVSDIIAAKLTAGKSPRHKKVEVYYGYGLHDVPLSSSVIDAEVLDWLDYETHFTMIVKSYEVGSTSLRFNCDDVQRLERVDIFIPQSTTLNQSITAEQMLIPINEIATSTKFQLVEHDASYSDRPGETVGYVIIEDEVICHTGIVDDVTYGVSLAVATNGRGALNTRRAGHQVDPAAEGDRKTKVTEFIYLEGAPLKLLYAIQTGVLYGQSPEVLPDHWHQGIPPALVRLADYENADPLYWNPALEGVRKLRFENPGKVSGEKFISTEILPAVVGFRPVYSDGSIGFKKLNSVLTGVDYVAELNDSNLISLGGLQHKLQDVINTIVIDWDYSFLTKQFIKTNGVLDATSLAKYGEGEVMRLAFKGLKSSAQTDQDLRVIFDGFRNRFAGGGIELSAEVLPRVNFLEVGDLVRVTTANLVDPITGDDFNRVCEIQQITPNTRTGSARLSLFASVEAAGEFEVTTATTVLDADWYSSAGTALNTVLTMTGNTVTANGSLTGGSTTGGGIFYHLGDLTIPSGITVSIAHNVQLRVRGVLTINGTISGIGGGFVGGAGGDLFTANNSDFIDFDFEDDPFRYLDVNVQHGTPGFFGVSYASKYLFLYKQGSSSTGNVNYLFSYFDRTPTVGRNSSAEPIPVVNRDGDISASVNNYDLRGTSGRGGLPALEYWRPTSVFVDREYSIIAPGGDGGTSGAGLLIVARGVSVGAAGLIDLSGSDATASPIVIPAGWTQQVNSGGGGGGQPGALYVLIDGNGSSDISTANVRQDRGLSHIEPGFVDAVIEGQVGDVYRYIESGQPAQITVGRSFVPELSMGQAGFRVQYIRPADSVTDGQITPPSYELQPISGLTLTSGNSTLLGARDGSIRERIQFEFTTPGEAQANGYEVQAKETGEADTEYRTVALVTIPRGFFDVTEGIDYTVRARVISYQPNVISSAWVSATHEAVGKSAAPANPSSFLAAVLKNGVVFQVGAHPDADFLEHIFSEDGTEIARGNLTLTNVGYRAPGAHTYTARARDRSGNLSAGTLSSSVTVQRPNAPFVQVGFSGENYTLTFSGAETSYAIAHYRILHIATLIAEVDSTVFSQKVTFGGTRVLTVSAIDAGGYGSALATQVLVTVVNPGAPVLSLTTAQNNVTIGYRSAPGSLPIARYDISKGSTFAGSVKFAEKAGTSDYTMFQELFAGTYTYWVVAYDTAGNRSAPSSIVAVVTMPVDYEVLFSFSERAEEFDGALVNGWRSSKGRLFMLVDDVETWDDYATNGYTTFVAEIAAGYPMLLELTTTTASYEKVYDLGSVISSADIHLNIIKTDYGTVTQTTNLAYSNDGVSYTGTAGNSITGTSFRYVRVQISLSAAGNNDFVSYTDIVVNIVT